MANRRAGLDARLKASVPDVLAAFHGRGGGEPELDESWNEMDAEHYAALAPGAGAEALSRSAATLVAPGADALSTQGIGYMGNPIGKTEDLLWEIRDDARANASGAALINCLTSQKYGRRRWRPGSRQVQAKRTASDVPRRGGTPPHSKSRQRRIQGEINNGRSLRSGCYPNARPRSIDGKLHPYLTNRVSAFRRRCT